MKLRKADLTSMIMADVKKKESQLAKEIVPEINKQFKFSLYDSLVEWYRDYNPSMYERTNNFLCIYETAKTTSNGNILMMQVDSSMMNYYPGFEIPPYPTYERHALSPKTAFDFMFISGMHGYGRWMMKQSVPPFFNVEQSINNGFNGMVQKIINDKLRKILR